MAAVFFIHPPCRRAGKGNQSIKGASMNSSQSTLDDGEHRVIPGPLAADAAAHSAVLIENILGGSLNVAEEARALATLKQELGLTHEELAKRVGRGSSTVGNTMRLLDLSEEILSYIERGQLYPSHGLALLAAKDPEIRGELARTAVQEGWTVQGTVARAHASNDDQRRPPAGKRREQHLDEEVQTMAELWGHVLSAEVQVRSMAYGAVRLEVQFTSVKAGSAAAVRLSETVSGGSQRRQA
jgi:ParB-like chromosome segregation protein Spo0J